MQNIILIGMPAVGKSTVGVLLAKRLGYRFIDSDLLIQEREGKLLHELLREHGVNGFLEIEDAVNSSITAERTVIATGGSVVYGKRAMEHLRSIGTVVYLKMDFETLKNRLGDYTHRGVVMPRGYTLEQMYDERRGLYEQYADIVLDEGEGTLSDTLERLCHLLEQKM